MPPGFGLSKILGSCTGGVDCRSSSQGAHTPRGSRALSSSRQETPVESFIRPSGNSRSSSRTGSMDTRDNNSSLQSKSSSSEDSEQNGETLGTKWKPKDMYYHFIGNKRANDSIIYGPFLKAISFKPHPNVFEFWYKDMDEWEDLIKNAPPGMNIEYNPIATFQYILLVNHEAETAEKIGPMTDTEVMKALQQYKEDPRFEAFPASNRTELEFMYEDWYDHIARYGKKKKAAHNRRYLFVMTTKPEKTLQMFGPLTMTKAEELRKSYFDKSIYLDVKVRTNLDEWTDIIRALPYELQLPIAPWGACQLPKDVKRHYIVTVGKTDKTWRQVPNEIAEKIVEFVSHERPSHKALATKKKPAPLDTARSTMPSTSHNSAFVDQVRNVSLRHNPLATGRHNVAPLDTAISIVPSVSHNFTPSGQVRNETYVPNNASQRHNPLAVRNPRAILDPLAKSAYLVNGNEQGAHLPGQIHGGRVKKRNKAPPNHNVAKGRKTATKPRKTRS